MIGMASVCHGLDQQEGQRVTTDQEVKVKSCMPRFGLTRPCLRGRHRVGWGA